RDSRLRRGRAMRFVAARLTFGLLTILATAGCHREASTPEAKAPAVAALGRPERASVRARNVREDQPATPRRWDDPEPIVVRARYDTVKGPCIRLSDGGWAMPAIDAFRVLEMIRGEPRATDIYVRPPYSVDTVYPRGLDRGDEVTIRV